MMRFENKAFAKSSLFHKSYFHFDNVQKAVSFVKIFSVDECLGSYYRQFEIIKTTFTIKLK